jgi:Skp family chaperone for outer membrane proteins
VKSKLATLVGLAILGVSLNLGNPVRAQGQTQPGAAAATAAPQSTRIATINMMAVMKGYKKFEILNKEMADLQKPYQDSAKQWLKYFQDQKAIAEDPTKSAEERDKAAKAVLDAKRKLEDINAQAEKIIRSHQDEKLVQVYREIQDAVEAYCQGNNIQVVLQYSDAMTTAEFFGAGNIQRKLRSGAAGAFSPMFIAPGVDISQAVVTLLNGKMGQVSGPTSNATTTGGQ